MITSNTVSHSAQSKLSIISPSFASSCQSCSIHMQERTQKKNIAWQPCTSRLVRIKSTVSYLHHNLNMCTNRHTWSMTHTCTQHALTCRRHSCAQSRWFTLRLWERSLSSVTTGNKGRSVECVNACLIHGTEPKPTERTVRLLIGVRCVPESQEHAVLQVVEQLWPCI